ncbi:MAG: hypothetical protein NTX22_01215 [Ignavibacteriales bacterium]|nr:hypothetical protein [Ignavibacteriales bacterium]
MNNRINLFFLLLQFLFLNFLSSESYCQTDSIKNNNLYSTQNILLFADFLFCQQDYLRAINEYEKYLSSNESDSVQFKISLAYLYMGEYNEAETKFIKLITSPTFSEAAQLGIAKSIFIRKDFLDLKNYYYDGNISSNQIKERVKSLHYFSMLYTRLILPQEIEFTNAFHGSLQSPVLELYNKKKNLQYRSPIVATFLSALIPGAGKIYAGEYSDGITSLVITGLLAFLSYDNFKAKHLFRGWLWGGMAAFFYAGNIYGSAAAAQIFNARINFDFTTELDFFIKTNNYFSPDYDFMCK